MSLTRDDLVEQLNEANNQSVFWNVAVRVIQQQIAILDRRDAEKATEPTESAKECAE